MANSSNRSIADLADKILNDVKSYIMDVTKDQTVLKSAIIESVNTDGTVNVFIPPNTDTIFNRISNQTPFDLSKGNSVELMVKNGNYSNCWVVAKHEATGQDIINKFY